MVFTREFSYKIKDDSGLHARPAGMLVKKASSFSSSITVSTDEKTADAKKLFALMALNIKCGQTIYVKAEGPDEEEAADALKNFLTNNL